MQTRSIFSVNTNQTGFKTINANMYPLQLQSNTLHEYFYKILPTFSKQCPYLSKLFYLQLILRENVLIYTQNRIDARDIWLYLSRMLDLKKPQIYVVDEKFNVQQLLNTKNQYQRVMLYDVGKLTIQNINRVLNSNTQISILGLQNQATIINTHVADLFSIVTSYHQQQNASHLVDTYNQQIQLDSARNFDKKVFNQIVKLNFQIVLQQIQEQGFLKPFVQLLQYKIQKANITIAQSKWKKMLRILKFIGVNKQEGVYKKMALGDFIMLPQLLALSIQQLKAISAIIHQAFIAFIPYYGLHKFEKSIKNHFWFSNQHIHIAKKITEAVQKNKISFFYPCIKFPETAYLRINPNSLEINYEIKGFQKKLMSDHHIQIEPSSKYILSMLVKSDNKMIVHLGIACYDKLKNIILPIQACRKQNSQVVYQRIQADRIIVKNAKNLNNWNNSKDNFVYERSIGVYFNGQIQQILPITQIIYNPKQPYTLANHPYSSINIVQNQQNNNTGEIILPPDSKQWFVNYKHLFEKDKTLLMNHFQGGVGCIGETLDLENSAQWKKIEITYQGSAFSNTGRNFFPSTKYIRLVVMVNYNNGYPNFQIENKNAVFQFKNITFQQIK